MSMSEWNPHDVLGVHPDKENNCVGQTKKKERCRCTVRQSDLAEAEILLQNLAATPLTSNHRVQLQKLACVTLCAHWHRQARPAGDTTRARQPQVAEKVREWSHNIELEIESRVQQNERISEAPRRQQARTSTVLVSVSSSNRAARRPQSRELLSFSPPIQRIPSLPIASRDDPFVDSPSEIPNRVTNSPISTATLVGGTSPRTAFGDSPVNESYPDDWLRILGGSRTSSASTSTLLAEEDSSRTASESPLASHSCRNARTVRANGANNRRQNSTATINHSPSSPAAETSQLLANPENISLEPLVPMHIIIASENDTASESHLETHPARSAGSTSGTTQPTRAVRRNTASETDTSSDNRTDTQPNETDDSSQTLAITSESPASITPTAQPPTPTHRLAPHINLPTPPTTITPIQRRDTTRVPVDMAVHPLEYTNPFTPPDSNERLPLEMEQISPLAHKQRRKPVGSPPYTPIPHPSARPRPRSLLTPPNSSQATPANSLQETPSSTAPLLSTNHNHSSPSPSPSPSSSPIPNPNPPSTSTNNEKHKTTTQIHIHEMTSAIATREEELVDVPYCRGRCGKVVHGCWRDIWSGGDDGGGRGVWAVWQRVRCSFWYLVDGDWRTRVGLGSGEMRRLEGGGGSGDGVV